MAILGLEGAAKVFGGDDVGGVLGPGGGQLAGVLLEDGLAIGASDHGGADLPGDLVVGVDLRDGEVASDGQPGLAVADDVRGGGVWCGAGASFGCERHVSPVLSNVIGD